MNEPMVGARGSLRRRTQRLVSLLGIGPDATSHGEKLISGVGALLGLLAVYGISRWYLGAEATILMLGSMGATAVLLFAVPHGALSQPWAVLGGHLLSAAIGVSCRMLFPGAGYTAALAVALAIVAMYYARCIHPPGGATALAAVIGGEEIHALGFAYLLTPVMLNTLTIFAVAVAFNGLYPWRRYPAVLARRHRESEPAAALEPDQLITHEDLAAAMEQLNSYIDVTSEDLVELFELAVDHARRQDEHPQHINVGGYYSNGRVGRRWCVREVLDASGDPRPGRDQVIYKNVAGEGLYETGICSGDDFRQWARFPVRRRGERWVRLVEPPQRA